MKNIEEKIKDLDYWSNNNDNFFEFFVDYGLIYTILITNYDLGQDFYNAVGNLYLSKIIYLPKKDPIFDRTLLLENCKVSELLEQAYIDYKANYE